MKTYIAFSLIALLAPATVAAQPRSLDTGSSLVGTAPTLSVAPTPDQILTTCFARCLNANGVLRAQVCGGGNATFNSRLCLDRTDIPACAAARRALSVGGQVIASAVCGRMAPAPATATAVDQALVAERRRRSLERLRDRCADHGAFAEDCVRCASSGQRWQPSVTPQQREIIRLSTGGTVDSPLSHAQEASARCVSRQVEAVHLVMADTRMRLANLTVLVENQRTSATGIPTGQPGLLGRVLRLQTELVRLTAAADRADTQMRVCHVNRRLPAIPVSDLQASDDQERIPGGDVDARLRAYGPRRTPPSTELSYVRCDRFEQLHREALEAVAAAQISMDEALVILDEVDQSCSAPASVACQGAQQRAQAFVLGRSAPVVPATPPPSAPPASAPSHASTDLVMDE